MPWSAEAAREHRAYRKSIGHPVKHGRAFCLFDQGEFVAIDGEGFSEGIEDTVTIGGRDHSTRPHHYALLASSDGSEICAPDGAYLGTAHCLDFIIDQAGKGRILVCFGGPYDFSHWLMDVDRDDVNRIINGTHRYGRKYADFTIGRYDYRVEIQMRKCFRVWRWRAGERKYRKNDKGKWINTCQHSAVVWDTWGFFQGTFVSALRQWLPNHPDTAEIIRMKESRSTFVRADMEVIREYNRKELALLVTMMDRVRAACQDMGLKLSRYDGAGAIASAMFKKHDVKRHKGQSPEAVFEAARYAYSGGHIEMYMLGHHTGYVFHADINSAYPYWLSQLPSLAVGEWTHGETKQPPEGFTLVHVKFSFGHDVPFYPLFYREDGGEIIYPRIGEGWYWWPEYDVARQFAELHGSDYFEVVEWWAWATPVNELPFAFVPQDFDYRRSIVQKARALGQADPGESITIKLGLNACSGKLAQQIGARLNDDDEVEAPPYFQLEWAGYVTAGCRSQIMGAAMQKPHAIIGVATDGIYATETLDLAVSTTKELGKWEVTEHKGITMVMPGVYWLHDEPTTKNPKGVEHHSRGFEKHFLEDHTNILAAWRKGETLIPIKVDRCVTMASACLSDALWHVRGRWMSSTRWLKINGDNSKRYSILRRQKPHKGLCTTHPRSQYMGFTFEGEHLMSAPYEIDWLLPDEVGAGVWDFGWGDDPEEGDVPGDVFAAELAVW